MAEPLFPFFDRLVLRLAGENWIANDLAPSSLADITNHWWLNHGQVWVSSLYSGNTIFGSPHVNHAFRAWHDRTHIKLGAEFDREGEARVCVAQQNDVMGLPSPVTYDELALAFRILECEVMGQFNYQAATGQFPADQRAFTVDYFNKRGWSMSP